jgi:hypothetical protein
MRRSNKHQVTDSWSVGPGQIKEPTIGRVRGFLLIESHPE